MYMYRKGIPERELYTVFTSYVARAGLFDTAQGR
jgi:hypothetical protein